MIRELVVVGINRLMIVVTAHRHRRNVPLISQSLTKTHCKVSSTRNLSYSPILKRMNNFWKHTVFSIALAKLAI